jgi:D-alanine-D-alanine ligase
MKKNVAIAMGGYSSEFDISIKSGNAVYKALENANFNLYRIVITMNQWYLLDDKDYKILVDKSDFSVIINHEKIHFDVVFNTIHGSPGENGLIQGYFENMGIPQTASSHYPAALTYNKRDCISVLKPYNIVSAKNFLIDKGDPIDVNAIIEKVGLPCFVKANRAGSSFGISKVKDKEALIPAIEHAYKEDDELIIEEAIDGREFSVGIVNYEGKPMVLPITEIISENEFFDFDAKYHGKSKEVTPASLDVNIQNSIQREALRIFKILKLKGLTRAEFIVKDNTPYFIEINTCPGLTEASILPQQAKAANISLEHLYTNAIEIAHKGK